MKATSETACANTSQQFGGRELFQENPTVVYAFIALYLIIGIGSVLGNGAILVIIFLKKEMRSVTNIFIASLAASDFLITAVPFYLSPFHFVTQKWYFGKVFCYLVHGLGGVSLFWSPFILAAMAIERFLVVMSPLSRFVITKKSCLIINFLIWISAGIFVIPVLIHVVYIEIPCYGEFCVEVWKDPSRLVYGSFVLVIRTLVPFAAIATCHFFINQRLCEQESRLRIYRSSLQQLLEFERKRRLQRLLISMVIIFAISSFPLDIYNIIQDARESFPRIGPFPFMKILYLPCHLLAMSGTLWNPIIYALCNENFKREIFSAVDTGQRKLATTAHQISRSLAKCSSANHPGEATGGNEERGRLLTSAGGQRLYSLSADSDYTRLTPLHSCESLPDIRYNSCQQIRMKDLLQRKQSTPSLGEPQEPLK